MTTEISSSIYHNHDISSFMTYHLVCNQSNTTVDTIGTGTALPCGVRPRCLLGFVHFMLHIHTHLPFNFFAVISATISTLMRYLIVFSLICVVGVHVLLMLFVWINICLCRTRFRRYMMLVSRRVALVEQVLLKYLPFWGT
jgi:hypothetical protein